MLTLRWQEWTQFNEVLAQVVLGCFVSYKSGLLLKKKGYRNLKNGQGCYEHPSQNHSNFRELYNFLIGFSSIARY